MKFIAKHFKFVLPAAVTMLALASGNAAAALKNVPLAINLDTVETIGAPVQPDGTPCPLGAAFAGHTGGVGKMAIGSGKKVYQGDVSADATDCATATMQFSNGKLTITAVNGDKLTATYYGSFIPTAPDSTSYIINNGAFAITGGTGYFVGASGTGQLQGTITIPANRVPPFYGNLKATGKITFSTEAFEQAYGMQQ
jgi:hypothetical protein